MNLKAYFRLTRMRLRHVFNPRVREAIRGLSLTFLVAFVLSLVAGNLYEAGYNQGLVDMAKRHETDVPMCTTRDTHIRENPTGFVMAPIESGDLVWVVQLQVPFAVVWYFDGTNWYLGTTTASYLTPCELLLPEPV